MRGFGAPSRRTFAHPAVDRLRARSRELAMLGVRHHARESFARQPSGPRQAPTPWRPRRSWRLGSHPGVLKRANDTDSSVEPKTCPRGLRGGRFGHAGGGEVLGGLDARPSGPSWLPREGSRALLRGVSSRPRAMPARVRREALFDVDDRRRAARGRFTRGRAREILVEESKGRRDVRRSTEQVAAEAHGQPQ